MPANLQIIRTALYARVSSEEQREGQTIDSQIAELERFAKEKGWVIIDIYKDEGWSGSLLARPDLDRLRDDASKGLFNIVLINDVDRLARDVAHLGIVKRDLEHNRVQVVFRKLPAESSPTHNLMVNILGSFAEFERELIIDRTRRGRRHKVEVRQEYLGSNTAYGYRYVLKDKVAGKLGYLVLAPEEAVIVKQMFEWVDTEGLSARKVVKRLNKMQAVPRKKADQWSKSSVLRILRNEMYAGVWHYNKFESCEPVKAANSSKYRRSLKSSLRRRPKTEWLPVILPEHLRIIDRDQWQRVQDQLNQNLAFSPRNTKHDYLLKGLVQCGGCGARYVGDPNHGRFYYRCHARCKKYPSVREQLLDETVWRAVEEAILNPSIISEQVEQLHQRKHKYRETIKSELQEMAEAISQVENEEERILAAYRIGVLSADQLGRELEKISTRKGSLAARKGELAKQAEPPALPAIKQSLMDYCNKIAQRLKSFGYEERQRFLRLILNRVVFEGNQIRIKGIIPVESSSNKEQRLTSFSYDQDKQDSADRIAAMTNYLRARNSASIVDFEVQKSLPEIPVPLIQQLESQFLLNLITKNPTAQLKALCKLAEQVLGIAVSTTTMCRALKRAGITKEIRHQVRKNPTPYLVSRAA